MQKDATTRNHTGPGQTLSSDFKAAARRMIACVGVASIATGAAAEIIELDSGSMLTQQTGFETLSIGSSVSAFDLGNVGVTVTTDGVKNNTIISLDDGYGAVANSGDRFWKLRGGTTTLDFDQNLTGLSFYYSDLESADVDLRFFNSQTGSSQTVQLTERRSNQNSRFSFEAGVGESFDSLSVAWQNSHGDGVGFDDFVATVVPAPGSIATLAVLGTLVYGRRR